MRFHFKLPFKLSAIGLPADVELSPEGGFELGERTGARTPADGERLDVPLREAPRPRPGTDQMAISILPLLDWHTRGARFVPRHTELDELRHWSSRDDAISVKVVTGAGGSGKSALAGAFAVEQQKQGWAAGFARLDGSCNFDLGDRGLVVLDYPEEHLPVVRRLLEVLDL